MRPIGLAALVLAVVMLAVLSLRYGGDRASQVAPRVSTPVFRVPELRGLDQVILRFEGEPRGEVQVVVGEGGHEETVDLSMARPLSRNLHEVLLRLSRVLVKPTPLEIRPVEGGEPARFDLDPTGLVEAELRAVDAVGTGDLDGLLRRVGDLRTRLARRRGAPEYGELRLAAELALGEVLGEAGLGRDHQEGLGQLLPVLLVGELPSGALARRLMPLRLVEMAVSERSGLRPPWGYVGGMLGFTFRGVARLQEVTPPPGFRRVGFCSLMDMVAAADGSGRRVPQYLWMVDADGQRQLLEREALAGMFSAGLAATVDEVIPRHDAWVTTTTTGLRVAGPVSRPSRLYLVLAGLIPGFVLEVTLPGGASVTVLHTADLDPGFIPAPLFTRFLVSFPVEAAGLVEGRNDVGLRLTKRSMGEPPLGLAFREIGLWTSELRGP